MKSINTFNPLLIRAIDNVNDVNILEYTKNAWILDADMQNYLVIKRSFTNTFEANLRKSLIIGNNYIEINSPYNCEKTRLNLDYGDKNAIIVDMNGIDNFRFANSLIFNDSTVRKIMLKMNLIKPKEKYLRIGASGARANFSHPGGEVFEYSEIDGNDGSGFSR